MLNILQAVFKVLHSLNNRTKYELNIYVENGVLSSNVPQNHSAR